MHNKLLVSGAVFRVRVAAFFLLALLVGCGGTSETPAPSTTVPDGKGRVFVTATGLPVGAEPVFLLKDPTDPRAPLVRIDATTDVEPGRYHFLSSGVKEQPTGVVTQDAMITVYAPSETGIEIKVIEGEAVHLVVHYTPTPVSAEVVNLPDAAFEQAVRVALGRSEGRITRADMATLVTVDVSRHASETVSIEGVQHATHLEILYLGGTEVSDLSPLRGHPRLRELYAWKYGATNKISDLSPLADVATLEVLWLDHNRVTDVSPLAELENLRKLELIFNDVEDISPLANLIRLEYLSLDANERVSDASALEGLVNLETLVLTHTSVGDLAPLVAMRRMKRLELTDLYGMDVIDIGFVANMPNLEVLRLDANAVTDLTPLAGHDVLVVLGLPYNQISDLTPLASLVSLQELYLCCNGITDITPLRSLTNLRILELQGNTIADPSVLAALPALERVELGRNCMILEGGAPAGAVVEDLRKRGIDVADEGQSSCE